MDFSVPPPNMRVGPGGQNKFANLNQRAAFHHHQLQPHQHQHPRPPGLKLAGPSPPHNRNLSFTPGSQIMMQPSTFPSGLVQPQPQPLAGGPYRPQVQQYQPAQYPAPAPAPVYQYQPGWAGGPQARYPLNMPLVSPGPSYHLVAPAPGPGQTVGPATSTNNNHQHPVATFQPPPGFTFPPQQSQPAVYNCPPPPPPPPTYQGPQVLMPTSASSSDIPDLRHQFLSTQFAGKPGQVIFLPPMSGDRSVQTIQVMSPQPGGQFSVQTIVLPIMKVDNTNQLQLQQINNNNNCQPQPGPAPPAGLTPSQVPALVEDSEEVMLNELEGPGLAQVMEGIDLDQVKQFAAEFKAARLSLGLTQTQVGQALQSSVVEGEENISVSQSTICRFEKLEITALQVKKLLPALRSWLDWAQTRQSQGLPVILTEGSDQTRDLKKRKKRTVFNKDTQRVLSEEFEQNNSPSSTQLSEMADRLRLDRETVRVWFCNKRQTIKKQETS